MTGNGALPRNGGRGRPPGTGRATGRRNRTARRGAAPAAAAGSAPAATARPPRRRNRRSLAAGRAATEARRTAAGRCSRKRPAGTTRGGAPAGRPADGRGPAPTRSSDNGPGRAPQTAAGAWLCRSTAATATSGRKRRDPRDPRPRACPGASRRVPPAAPGRARRAPWRGGEWRPAGAAATSAGGGDVDVAPTGSRPAAGNASRRPRLLRATTYGYGEEEPLGSSIKRAAQPPGEGGRRATPVSGVSPAGRHGARRDRGTRDARTVERGVPVPVVWTRTADSEAVNIAPRGSGDVKRHPAAQPPHGGHERRDQGSRRPQAGARRRRHGDKAAGRRRGRQAPRGARGAAPGKSAAREPGAQRKCFSTSSPARMSLSRTAGE